MARTCVLIAAALDNDTLSSTSQALFTAVEALGTVAFGISGAMAAGRAKMDWFGVVVLGVIVAVGGGTVRDLLLGNFPVWWVEDSWPVPVAAASALATIPIVRRGVALQAKVVLADSIGLGAFAVAGSHVALDWGAAQWLAVVLGIVTATFGGVLRDVLVNETPLVLTGEIYALAAGAGAALYVILNELDVHDVVGLWAPIATTVGLRVIAVRRGWSLPIFEHHAHGG